MVHENHGHSPKPSRKNANEIPWYPDYMRNRLIDWTKALDWDWVVSRQRLFATPIPVWYCKSCGEIIVAQESWVPIDPRMEHPRIEKCPKCGGKDFSGETDVIGYMDGFLNYLRRSRWLARSSRLETSVPRKHPPIRN